MKVYVCVCTPSQLLLHKESFSLVSGPEKEQEKQREHLHHPDPGASVTWRLHLIYLVVDAFAVESYVNSEGGRVVVRHEQWLLVRFVPHHEVQRSGTLMGEDMSMSRAHTQRQQRHVYTDGTCDTSTSSPYWSNKSGL